MYVPKDRVTGAHQGYGFVEFRNEEDAEYAVKVMNMVKLFGKPIRVNKASQDRRQVDVGANLFIGNLDPDVDEQVGAREGQANRQTGRQAGGLYGVLSPGSKLRPAAVVAQAYEEPT